jgi:hypothetical protein
MHCDICCVTATSPDRNVGGAALLAEQYQIIKDAYRAEGVPLANARVERALGPIARSAAE